jgi:hopanoid C-3 methylase
MKVLLVNPPRSPHNGILAHASADVLPFIHKKLVGPPLGLLTIAGAVRDHDVRLLELKAEYDLRPDAPAPEELVRRAVEEMDPDVVGVTAITSELRSSLALLGEAKRTSPRAVTAVGGLHAALVPSDFAGTSADVVFPGPSTRSFAELVRAVEAERPLGQVRGVWLNDGGRYAFTGEREERADEAGAGFVLPRRDLVAPWRESYVVGRSPDPATYLFTSLGCPHRCTFCSIWPQHGGTYAQRDVESVVAELAGLDDYPVVRFADANTVVDAAWVSRLFDRIEAEGIRKFFIMDMRVDTAVAHPALVEKMARGGLGVVIAGFESTRDDELEAYDKATTRRQIDEAIRIFHDNGVMLRGNYVVPPDYGADDFARLADYAASHRVTYAGYTVLTPMPGTVHHAEVADRIVDRDPDKYNFFNCVLPTRLPLDEFYARVASLWAIKKGREVI